MFRNLATLAILSLWISVAFGSATTLTGLNNTATKVCSGTNSTDSTVWGTVQSAVFGPGSNNSTSYVYGWPGVWPGATTINTFYKRTLNATIVSWGNDTTEAAVEAVDTHITPSTPIPCVSYLVDVAPGYLAMLSSGNDAASLAQVYVTIIATSATTIQLTATATSSTTSTSFGFGRIFYDRGSGAFFYCYLQTVGASSTYTNTIYVGGVYVNGTKYWKNDLPIHTVNNPGTNQYFIFPLICGNDNWLNSSNIYVSWKESATPAASYFSKTTKATTTTAAGSATLLVTDTSKLVYSPLGIWASNVTYGLASALTNSTSGSNVYSVVNFLNGSTTSTLSGIDYSSAAAAPINCFGWMLTTGYTLIAAWPPSATSFSPMTYTWGTFYANGTANMTSMMSATSMTSMTLGTVAGSISFFEDINGTEWVGWTDLDTTNKYTYNAYLAIFQGQLNSATLSSSANATIIFAFGLVLFLAAIFVF